MKKKEFLIILILAVLLIGCSGAISHPSLGCGDFPDALCESGWPLGFRLVGGFAGVDRWIWPNLILDFFFWLLVLAAGYWILKLVSKKIKMKK